MPECIIKFNNKYKIGASINFKSSHKKGGCITICFYPPSFLKLLNLIKQSVGIKSSSLICISIPDDMMYEIYRENFDYQESLNPVGFVKFLRRINGHYDTVLNFMRIPDSLNTKEIYLDYYLNKLSLQDLKQSLQQLKETKENTTMIYYSTRFGGSKGVTIIESDNLPDEDGKFSYYLKGTTQLDYATLNKDAFETIDEAIESIEKDIKRKIEKLEKHLIKVKKQKNNL